MSYKRLFFRWTDFDWSGILSIKTRCVCPCMRTVSNTFLSSHAEQMRWIFWGGQLVCGKWLSNVNCSQPSICRASLILCKILTVVCHSVADDFWFETRSEVYSVDRVNLHLDWVFISLLEFRNGWCSVYDILAQWIEVYCPRCGVRTSRLRTHRE